MQDRGKLTLGSAILMVCLFRLAYFLGAGIEPLASTPLLSQWLTIPSLYQLLVSLTLLVVTAMYTIVLCNQFILLHERGRILFGFFFFAIAGTHSQFFFLDGYIPALFLLSLAFYRLFACYDSSDNSRYASEAGLCIGFASVLWTPMLFASPLFLINFYQLKAFSTKHILSFLMGLFIPAWMAIPVLYFLGAEEYFLTAYQSISSFDFHPLSFSFTDYLYPIALLIIIAFGSIYMRFNYWSEKVFTRSLLNTLSLSAYYFITLSFFLPLAYQGMLFLSTLPIAILLTKSVIRIKWKRRNLFFAMLIFLFVIIELSSSFTIQ